MSEMEVRESLIGTYSADIGVDNRKQFKKRAFEGEGAMRMQIKVEWRRGGREVGTHVAIE